MKCRDSSSCLVLCGLCRVILCCVLVIFLCWLVVLVCFFWFWCFLLKAVVWCLCCLLVLILCAVDSADCSLSCVLETPQHPPLINHPQWSYSPVTSPLSLYPPPLLSISLPLTLSPSISVPLAQCQRGS